MMNTKLRNEIGNDILFVRHMILNSIRAMNNKFKNQYGEMVLACDSPDSWRKEHFPYYKYSRSTNRSSDIDWKALFEILDIVREELTEYFPYRVIKVPGCEADDIIGVLARTGAAPILIVSMDKDFVQLHNEVVSQYDPVRKRFIEHPDGGAIFLKQHIIRGDPSDGVPNILSDDDCFVIKKRQGRITEKQILSWMFGSPEQLFTGDVFRRYKRNELLIDLAMTPHRLEKLILDQFAEQKDKPKNKIFDYLIHNKLKQLLENIQDFT